MRCFLSLKILNKIKEYNATFGIFHLLEHITRGTYVVKYFSRIVIELNGGCLEGDFIIPKISSE